MPLRHRKHRTRFGFPEVLIVIGFALASVFGGLWHNSLRVDRWASTAGEIVAADIRKVHYNATQYTAKATIEYTYQAGGLTYAGHFAGIWPAMDSPNALSTERIWELEDEHYALTVLYDPKDPARSSLHGSPAGQQRLFANLTIASLLFTILHVLVLYPRWKRAQATVARPIVGPSA